MDIKGIGSEVSSHLQRPDKNSSGQDQGFADAVKKAIYNVSNMQAQADQSAQELVQGKAGIHETMLSMQKASISFDMLLQIRNKVMDAYKEVMRMQF